MKPTLPFAQYDKDANHLHILHKDIPDGVTNLYAEDFVRQQQAEIEALKESNKNLMELVTMLREEINKLREGISENDLAIALAGLTKAAYEQGVQENERLKDGFSLAFWHDTFVEVKKPNSDVIYRFNINETCKHGIDDGACKECYLEGLK